MKSQIPRTGTAMVQASLPSPRTCASCRDQVSRLHLFGSTNPCSVCSHGQQAGQLLLIWWRSELGIGQERQEVDRDINSFQRGHPELSLKAYGLEDVMSHVES